MQNKELGSCAPKGASAECDGSFPEEVGSKKEKCSECGNTTLRFVAAMTAVFLSITALSIAGMLYAGLTLSAALLYMCPVACFFLFVALLYIPL